MTSKQTDNQNIGKDVAMGTILTSSSMENLLLDAQYESARNSQISSKNSSPKNSNLTSPFFNIGSNQTSENDWVHDWASRPEINQKIKSSMFKHPPNFQSNNNNNNNDDYNINNNNGNDDKYDNDLCASIPPLLETKKRKNLSIRKTKIMKKISSFELPISIITHTFSFILGAAIMALYMKKFHKTGIVPFY